MAESAELADKLQGSACRLTSVPVNFQVCDWGATDIHCLLCEHEAGGCSSSIYQYRRFGLLWFWKRLFTSSQRACEAHEPEQTIVQHVRTKQQWSRKPSDPEYQDCPVGAVRNSSGHACGNSWAEHGDSTAWGGLGDRGTMQAAHGHQESRAGELGHCGSRQIFTLVILPLGQALLPRTNSSAKRTWVRGENSTASLSSPWNQGLFLLPTGQLLRGGLGSEVTGLATESSSSWLSEDPRGHSTTHQPLQHRLHGSSGTEILIPAYPAFSSPDRKALHPQLDKV